MKIGILSVNIHSTTLSYGSMLHSYAFQKFLDKNHIDSDVIEYKPAYFGDFDEKHPLFSYVSNPIADENAQRERLIKWRELFYEREKRYDKFQSFAQRYKKTEKCYDQQLLDETDLGYDCYICASDVIWKYNQKVGFDRGFYLACKSMQGKKKIAYAASKGSPKHFNLKAEEDFIKWISDFDAISVRQQTLKEYIKEKVNLDVLRVVDPVFLMDASFYEKLEIKPKDAPENGFLVVCLAMDNNDELVQTALKYGKDHNLSVIELSVEIQHRNFEADVPYKVIYDAGVEEWLWYLHNAEIVFTNSFHAASMSIIYNTQFFAGGRGGGKIEEILDMFGLGDRWLLPGKFDDYNKPNINYDAVNILVNEAVTKSSDFLLTTIKNLENSAHKSVISNPKHYIISNRIRWIKNQKKIDLIKKIVKKLIR
ncbi:polysaccharide pyruvyl transferase family protein [Butyrivibrio sp. NC2002]|uniref:polysaccharide pyruvyl transferase family protein n=1 Tax=Butyrivibrio sp. NC2002 TaxID=1410610 RepID=UPI00056B3279|nr:polysaccharide pyruvyl transferase family protein [Butyrivibrio sp. NC2002]